MALLQAAVNPDPNLGRGGGDITVVGGMALLPETGPEGTMADIEEGSSSGQISIYVVRSGDSLGAIAKMFGVTVNTIVWANDLTSATIREGQTLIILPVSGVRHIVKEGETTKSIATKYKTDLAEVIQYNNLSETVPLAVGTVLIIPDAELAAPNLAPAARVRGAGGPSYDGYYMRPILGGRKSQGLHGYNGVDLATYYGAPIFAAAEGTIIISKNDGWNGGYGRYIVVDHDNGTQTLYAHNSQNLAYVGMRVVRGQLIGYVGSSGRSTGPHVHFEVRGARNPF